ncbi:hypothetical protein O181_064345 [Austropuccinia psidii MF-1]|uniref:GAG-pre-integrase domain-containing protein n=1 Tax=Austropuccinia psidii MF-1 TaxID=1389203 RepID=A0A9Q3ESZ7_9BASI|nr:hypothetical protein [Austropuccinia psidii MF-1]
MPEIPINHEDSSSEEELIKTKLIKLTRTNWVQWSCQVENYFISKGMDDLFSAPTDEVKNTNKFRKKNSCAIALLWSSISPEFEGILLNNKTSFLKCWDALGSACGKNSIITLSRTLQKLINLCYEPGSSQESHINEYHKLHAHYQSLTASRTSSMQLTSDMAAIFFLHSLDNDKELSGLCQTMYDLKPFELNAITDRVAVEHSRRQNDTSLILLADKNKQKEPLKQTNQQDNATSGQRRNTNRSKKKGFLNKKPSNPPQSLESDSNKRLENLEKLMNKLQSTLKISSVNVTDTPNSNDHLASDSDAFMIDYCHSLVKPTQSNIIYLDSGAGRTVVKDLSLLQNPVRVNKQINTFSLPVTIKYEGTLIFKGIHIHPVYYVPDGPVNLLSVSQLCDHGLKISTKSNMMLVKQHNKIVAIFHREGNLFAMKIPTPTIYSITVNNPDWHITLGHPNDNYLEKMIKTGIITGNYTKSSECEICKIAKIKNHPHLTHLPQTKSPFFKLHVDTLQISPANKKGHCYILVIVDDYSR